MRIYISGAITGTGDYMERFAAAEEKLKAQGHMVYNPAHANQYMPDGTIYEEYMRIAFALLDMAEAIYMLDGWEQSRGANREYGYALAKGYPVLKEKHPDDMWEIYADASHTEALESTYLTAEKSLGDMQQQALDVTMRALGIATQEQMAKDVREIKRRP